MIDPFPAIPCGSFIQDYKRRDAERRVVVVVRHGPRSAAATTTLSVLDPTRARSAKSARRPRKMRRGRREGRLDDHSREALAMPASLKRIFACHCASLRGPPWTHFATLRRSPWTPSNSWTPSTPSPSTPSPVRRLSGRMAAPMIDRAARTWQGSAMGLQSILLLSLGMPGQPLVSLGLEPRE